MSKRALIVGINYTNTSNELQGCINDAHNIHDELLTRGYNIVLLTDNTDIKPTRENILKGFLDLILSGAPELFFHYSGHGTYVYDYDRDEDDNRDEALVPIDCDTAGYITDDEIRGLLFCLSEKQKMTCVLDACHSGTGMDLKYNLYERYGGTYLSMKDDGKHRPTRGQCIMFSGCQDPQSSLDSWEDGKAQGAMTYAFLKALHDGAKTYEDLIKSIRKIMKDKEYTQYPNLSSGQLLNLRSIVKL